VIRSPEVLEATRRIDTVVLDKTGTVTTGRMAVISAHPADGVSKDRLLSEAAGIESASEHPIARAIVAGTEPYAPAISAFQALAGHGVRGVVDGREVIAGRAEMLRAQGITVPSSQLREGTAVAVASDGVFLGEIVVADTVRPTSPDAIAGMRALGLHPVLLTGDRRHVAESVAAQVGITDVIAETLPGDKLEAVNTLRRKGRVVAMVGDGVNDAAALAVADLGIAMGAGADAAIQASDVTLMRSNLSAVPVAIRLSRTTLGAIKTNLFWAFAYNVAAIPLAAGGLVTPVVAAGAMALSTAFVVANSMRLLRFK
jgi:P-type Cu+ transporter